MEFDFYRNFLVLAESNTMSAAARKLNIVQTALSSQITKLEEYYGVKLVKRQKGSKHIELTAAGIEFAGKVRTLCQSEDELALAMENMMAVFLAPYALGFLPCAVTTLSSAI